MSIALPQQRVAAGELLQHVSRTRYRGQDLFYGRDGSNRYDAVDGSYGVLYLGADLPTALMESVFHQHQWHRRKMRNISLHEVRSRLVRAVGVVRELVLADLTAPGAVVQHFGLNLSQIASRRYTHSQRISRAVYDHIDPTGEPIFDGLLYPSRNNYPASCMALFERAARKVRCVDDIDLADHVGWPAFVSDFRIAVVDQFLPGGRRPRLAP